MRDRTEREGAAKRASEIEGERERGRVAAGEVGEKRAKRQKVESIWQLDFTTK